MKERGHEDSVPMWENMCRKGGFLPETTIVLEEKEEWLRYPKAKQFKEKERTLFLPVTKNCETGTTIALSS